VEPLTLLPTKLLGPQVRPDSVHRPGLMRRLGPCLDCRLTLVSAPVGLGKSTLVVSSLAYDDHRAAWLSLDEGDSDPARFRAYFIVAIPTVDQEVGTEAREIVESPQLRNAGSAAVSLPNDISERTHDLILVLDDYHVVEAGRIHDRLGCLLDRQPANLHMAWITRSVPPLSLAHLPHMASRSRAGLWTFSSLQLKPRFYSST